MRFLLVLPRFVVLACIRFYQKTFSFDHGFLKFLFPHGYCRFYPSCSAYAYEAVRKYGVIKGVLLAIWRVLRCNPLSKGGNDPVR